VASTEALERRRLWAVARGEKIIDVVKQNATIDFIHSPDLIIRKRTLGVPIKLWLILMAKPPNFTPSGKAMAHLSDEGSFP
jgi:hypothetical protein